MDLGPSVRWFGASSGINFNELATGIGSSTAATNLQLARSCEEHWLNVESFFLKKVQKEIEDVFGFSGTISYQDQRKLPYTNAVIHDLIALMLVISSRLIIFKIDNL
ncbi:CYP2B5: Cytochrome protein [Crotalus adamanteus]|uniref:CYP2B5: Cytochrome protein n=1 Tax=Crotalus adamanteus TaxID=8729 RepID=A0AAW1BGU1_CROAD